MELMGLVKRWQVAARDGEVPRGLGVSPLVGGLLCARGHGERSAAERFLTPKLQHLSDPATLPGAAGAAALIAAAVANGRPIVIYGDYDVDGITATAILWHTLMLAGATVSTYVPHRIDEGYGLNVEAVRQLASGDPVPLMVTVDCGITAVEAARVASELGMELIITDHHHFDVADLPEAAALVHPRLSPGDANSGAWDLCGAGVAYKLAWQIARELCGSERLPETWRELLVKLLPLVALGTVADVVPLTGENRILVAFGLRAFPVTRLRGLIELIRASGIGDKEVTAYHLGFVLGPRLNASGRMEHAEAAVRLLTAADDAEAAAIAQGLNAANQRRRDEERAIVEQARGSIERDGHHAEDRRAIVVAGDGWHPGVVGIVASRLVEAYHRPVVVLCRDNGTARGSARSVEGISIHDALHSCGSLLTKWGGHAMAAGLELPSIHVDALRDGLVNHINPLLPPDRLRGTIRVDATIEAGDCRVEVFREIDRLAPFGCGNPMPRLLLRNSVIDRVQRMGGSGLHLALHLRGDGAAGNLRGVAFDRGNWADTLVAGMTLDIVFRPKLDMWQGRTRAELMVEDVRVVPPAESSSPL